MEFHFNKHAGQRRKNAYVLQRVIRCASSGRPLRIQSAVKYRYYKKVSRERGLDCAMAAKAIKLDEAHQQVLQILGNIHLPVGWQGEIRRMTEDLDYLQQMQNHKAAIDEQLRRRSHAMVDGGISGWAVPFWQCRGRCDRLKLLKETQ